MVQFGAEIVTRVSHLDSRYVRQVLLTLWVIACLVVLVIEVTPLELTAPTLKMLIYLAAFFGPPVIVSYLLSKWLGLRRMAMAASLSCGVILAGLVLFFSSFGLRYLFASDAVWRSVTVLYRQKGNQHQMITYQMMDVGAFGYRRRLARTVELSGFLSYSVPITEAELNEIGKSGEWIEVNEERNPFEWKGG